MGHLVTQFQGQILRDAANNRVRGQRHFFRGIWLVKFYGRFSINYFRGLGLRIED